MLFTTFLLTRLAMRRTTAGAAAGDARSSTARPPLVLVVDDESGIIEFLRYALEDSGYRVATARDGEDALTAIQQERPNFVLTDLMMPRLDGWELCRRLRQDASMHDVPIVAMSAVPHRGIEVDAFLPKPFELDDLLNTLHEVAGGAM